MSGDTEVITCNVTLLAFKLDKKNAKIIKIIINFIIKKKTKIKMNVIGVIYINNRIKKILKYFYYYYYYYYYFKKQNRNTLLICV